MPRVKHGQGAELTVAPWVPAKRLATQRGEERDAEARTAGDEQLWSVTEENLMAAAPAAARRAVPAPPQRPRPAAEPAARQPAAAGGWISTRRRQPQQEGGSGAEAAAARPDPPLAGAGEQPAHPQRPAASPSGRAERAPGLEAAAAGWDAAQQRRRRRRHAGRCLEGVARLALLPSGDLTGHFIPDAGGSSFGLMGQQLLAQHSCYRDTEWGLLRLSLIRFDAPAARSGGSDEGDSSSGGDNAGASGGDEDDGSSGSGGGEGSSVSGSGGSEPEGGEGAGAEITTWVQRDGGDLARLSPADPGDEDTAAALAADGAALEEASGGDGGGGDGGGGSDDESGRAPPFPSVFFSAHTLLSDAAAEAALAAFAPRLAGRGAVVNVGRMALEGLPPGFAPRPWRRPRRRWHRARRGGGGPGGGGPGGGSGAGEGGGGGAEAAAAAAAAPVLRLEDLGGGAGGAGGGGASDSELW
ncbi:hypothetical protein Rsub_00769 [Raphidocelis subcapitata]|uniref:Uncharacterized protein n=1 Tax=Raphidocelis subcapitata TaxID=307507 RepID=A0A2V0NT04_9CHLO|nr:hypothetical protein Rsub_00769 [Raphidocelis subcapitata]|eukprot:GBF88057.1 hypothetical protein Rsub_00769 [Raphidocelis subcapitata]